MANTQTISAVEDDGNDDDDDYHEVDDDSEDGNDDDNKSMIMRWPRFFFQGGKANTWLEANLPNLCNIELDQWQRGYI